MGDLGPLHFGDSAHAPRGFENGPEAIGTDEHRRDPPSFDLYLVEQTARTAAASITVCEKHGIAIVDARPLVASHDPGGVIPAPDDADDVVPLAQHRLDMVHQL